MTGVKGWLHVLGAALIVGLLACSGSTFCPNCESAVPVATVGYPASLPELVQGTAFTLQPAPKGGKPTGYLLVSGVLPLDLTLDPATGVISGVPNQTGVFPVSIQASNAAGGTDQALTFIVRPSGDLTVAYPTPLTFPAGTAIPDQTPTLDNATPGLATTYSLGATTLPSGLALNADGTITGTPTTVGPPQTFTVTATNGARTASCNVVYTISPAGSLTLNYYNVPAATTVGTAFGPLTPTLSNETPGVASTYAVSAGALPPGLALSHSTGTLSGTPTAAGSFSFTVTATNGARTANAALTVLVVAVPTAASLVPSTTTPAYGATVALTPTFAGGTATIGTTGVGSSNVSAAAATGTPVTSGPITAATTFTLTVTNAAGTRASTTCTVTPQTVSGTGISPANPNVTAGLTQAFTATFTGGATGAATWTATGGSFAGNVWTAPAAPGPYTITATSVDDPTKTVSTTATVYAAPVATSLAASALAPAFGGAFTLTPTYANGTGSLNFSVTCPPSGTASAAITANWTGARTYILTVTNVPGQTATASVTVTPQGVAVSAVAPAAVNLTTGFTQTFTATVTGAANTTVNWSVDGIAGGNASVGTITAGGLYTAGSTAGTRTIRATAAADGTTSQTATATVYAAPVATSLAASTTTPAFGSTFTLTPTYANGTGSLNFSVACPPSGTASAAIAANWTGARIYTLTVTNVPGQTATANVTVTPQGVAVSAVSPATVNLTVGFTQTFTATVTGAANTTVNWSVDGIAGGNASVGTITAGGLYTAGTTTGTHTIRATAAADGTTSQTAIATVYAAPVATSLTASTTSPDFGSTFTLTPVYANGTGSLNFSVTCPPSESASAAITANWTGARTYVLTVTNVPGQTAVASVVVTTATVTVSAVSPATVDLTVGQTQTFTATVTGAANTTVNWSVDGNLGGNPALGTITAAGLYTAGSSTGTHTIRATAAVDGTTSQTATATVYAAPVATSLTASATTPAFGSTFTLTPTYANGTGSLDFSVTCPASGTASAAIPADWTGPRVYTLTVTNVPGQTATADVTVTPQTVAITAISPANPTVPAGTEQAFTAEASGGATNTITWSADGGSFTGATWTAPLTNGVYIITARSDDDTSVAVTTTATVDDGLPAPLILTQPVGTFAASGTTSRTTLALATTLDPTPTAAGTFEVTAAGPGPLAYQWFRIPAGSGATGLQNPVGDGHATLTLDATASRPANDGDQYFVVVRNAYGQAVSADAPLAVGNGILLQAGGQPRTAFAASGASASFTVTVTSADPGALQYQWYACAPGAAAFTAIPGATAATWTTPAVQPSDSGTLYRCVVTSLDPGVFPATSRDAALFVDTPGTLGGLADGWQLNGEAVVSGSGIQLSAAAPDQAGSAFWPQPVSTARLTLAFTVALDDPSPVPGDGFALVFADPSRGATAASLGATGSGLGARGIPGAVLAFDTLANPAQGLPGQAGYLPADSPVPFLGLGRSEAGLWGQPWQLGFFALPGYPGSRTDPAAALRFASSTHTYRVTVADGVLTVTMDGAPVLTGAVDLPPAALVGFTAGTSARWERTVVSDFSAALSVP